MASSSVGRAFQFARKTGKADLVEQSALVITAKYPQPGQVKTRLARRLGFGLATELYRALLRDLDARLSQAFPAVYWAYTPAESPFPDFLRPGRSYLVQQGDDLGERMFEAFRSLLLMGHEKVVLVGCDLPMLSRALVEEAIDKLDRSDVVLGPAADGGYYLIGMRDLHDLFSYVSWSTPLVFAQTLVKAAELGLSVEFLPETFDVDEPDDIDKLQALLADREARASLPRTAAVLAKIRPTGGSLGSSKVGKYFIRTPEQAALEERECLRIVRPEDVSEGRKGKHMALVATVAGALTRRLREDLGIPLSDIAVVSARYHDAYRSDDRSYHLRPYGLDTEGLYFPHDGHEAKLAFALSKTGAKTMAMVIRKHGVLRILDPDERTIDENILLLADAMVEAERIVPVSVRRQATIGRYASDNPHGRRAYGAAYDVVEQTLEMFFRAGVDRRRFFQELGLPID